MIAITLLVLITTCLTVANLVVLGLNLKLYTEFSKATIFQKKPKEDVV